MITALQPTKFQIRKLGYELSDEVPPCFITKRDYKEHYGVEMTAGYVVAPPKDNHCGILFRLGFRLQTESPDSDKSRFKAFEIECEGFFVISRKVTPDFINDDFVKNCLVLLYGTMRGQVHIITAQLQSGALFLPGIVMDEVIKQVPNVLKAADDLRANLLPQQDSAKSTKRAPRKTNKK